MQQWQESFLEATKPEVLPPSFPAIAAELCSKARISQQINQALWKFSSTIQIHIESSDPIKVNFWSSIMDGGHYGDSLAHRFDVNKAKPLSAAGHRKDVGLRPDGTQLVIGHKTAELDPGTSGRFPGQRLDRRATWASPNKHQACHGHTSNHFRPALYQFTMTFIPVTLVKTSKQKNRRGPGVGRSGRRGLVALGRQPTDPRPGKASVNAVGPVACISAVANQHIRAPRPSDAVRPCAFPHFNP